MPKEDDQERLAKFRRAKRVQLNFTSVPEPLKEAFVAGAERRQMGMKEYLVYLMRQDGIDVPPYEDLDGRVNR